ncbi:T9SS type A sorting domain-containing protein [Psychroserpens sp. AS72]|uniref:T9SS type A sorting domain-containing protein n=1 Tax=Psychroserpens sp. AS72 TaxID=3135775 RepID=UPI003173CED3
MKKITLLFLMFLAFTFGNAQETISFEAPAYTLGDVYAQNGWTTTGDGAGGFITNQVISDELATDGTASLKIVQETAFGGQTSAIVGAFYNYGTPVAQDGSIFSADINISQQDANSSNFIFGMVNLTAGSFITWLEFDFGGNIFVLVDDGLGTVVRNDTGIAWSANTWYNVRIEFAASIVTFFVDDTQISTGTVIIPDAVEQVRFSHDNFEGFAYIDNFRTNDEELSVNEFDFNSFTHFYNDNIKQLKLSSPQNNLNTIEIYDVIGKRVKNQVLNGNEDVVELATLKNGVYLARISTENGTKTIKFIKS